MPRKKKLPDKLMCIRFCIVNGKRYKVGQYLDEVDFPKPGERDGFLKYFEEPDYAARTIKKNRFKELGVDPEKEQKLRAVITGVQHKIKSSMDTELPPLPKGVKDGDNDSRGSV